MSQRDEESGVSISIPWVEHALRAGILLGLILLFQQFYRGSLTPSVAIVAALGYVLMAELVRRLSG